MTVLLESLRVLTTCSSVLLNVSPWPEFARINRQRTPGPLTVLPVVMLFCNSFLWTMYGFMVGQLFPLFATCFMGQCTCIGFILIYYRWSPDRPAVRRLCLKAGSIMAMAMLYVILGAHGFTHQSRNQVVTTLGFMCITVNICLYASPLDTMKRVVQTKSAASLPISLCTVNLLNGLLWVAFGLTEGDYFVLTPNAIGSVLSTVQVALYFMYCSTEESRREEAEIQAAAAALETMSKASNVVKPSHSYGSLGAIPHTCHSVVDEHHTKFTLHQNLLLNLSQYELLEDVGVGIGVDVGATAVGTGVMTGAAVVARGVGDSVSGRDVTGHGVVTAGASVVSGSEVTGHATHCDPSYDGKYEWQSAVATSPVNGQAVPTGAVPAPEQMEPRESSSV
ncbi:hypothetical protein JM18_009064 [Phytophthora kernoviae]|uniref:Sugar transporter SWEET1 n=2 Tax=Phytophthora kernoviae TaxID=325452 RepID=A0A921V3R2_9STRA|nr:hypothetical protein JM18_009064 [Phytophthora kernoviae]